MSSLLLITSHCWSSQSHNSGIRKYGRVLRGFAWAQQRPSERSSRAADGALCLFRMVFLEGAPVTGAFSTQSHKWTSWAPHKHSPTFSNRSKDFGTQPRCPEKVRIHLIKHNSFNLHCILLPNLFFLNWLHCIIKKDNFILANLEKWPLDFVTNLYRLEPLPLAFFSIMDQILELRKTLLSCFNSSFSQIDILR